MSFRPLLAFALLFTALPLAAQQLSERNPLNASLRLLLQQHEQQRATRGGIASDSLVLMGQRYATAAVPLTLTSTDAQATASAIQAAGHHATAITETFLTARVPASYLSTLAALPGVRSVSLSRQHRPSINEARKDAKVEALHKGTGLETPFTGKGVILGVIDQGFEYRHPAFMSPDGKTSRVIAVWNRAAGSRPSTQVPTGGESNGDHATHVTNIAAGTNLGHELHGVAPDAEIVMIPSDLNDDEVVEDVKYVKDLAEKAGKPWVVNMSFGSQTGSHDGLTKNNQALSKLTGRGALIAAAVGNEGDKDLHASTTIAPGQTKYLLLEREEKEDKGKTYELALVDIWGQSTDSLQHLKITPFLYYKGKVEEQTAQFWSANLQLTLEVDADNKKSHANAYVACLRGALQKAKKLSEHTNVYSGFKIELADGATTPEIVHLWVDYGKISYLNVAGQKDNMLRADNAYQVGEGAASIPTAIAVGSYNTSLYFNSITDGKRYRVESVGNLYARSTFSNIGPFLNPDYPKPAVLAPGAMISSAINQYDAAFDASAQTITHIYTGPNRKKYYYAVMQGTSMATPFVAGVLCLWLQANPQLDYHDVMNILKKTSRRGGAMGTDEWNAQRGYGKIDAYAGLKEALAMANVSGLTHVHNSATPVSIEKTATRWRFLFNNPERYATLHIYNMAGQLVHQQHLQAVQQGQELELPLSALPSGTYLVQLRTAASHSTHRLLVP